MNPAEFDQFTTKLTYNLAADERVIGLVAAGSMAQRDYQPDVWSDHDFFIIVTPGAEDAMKSDLSWLPLVDEIVLAFHETAHGMKVLYRQGHLLEFAVFDKQVLQIAKVNRYAVLLDKAEIAPLMARLERETAVSTQSNPLTDHSLMGQFLANLFVGVGRHARGEQISGRIFVHTWAVGHLLHLYVRHLPAENNSLLDNLDPYRRFERVYPQLGRQLNDALNQPILTAVLHLLSLCETTLADKIPSFPHQAIATVRQYTQAQMAITK
jgi:hypothetical protein